ncbi:uncharacterized protein LOC113774816 [Coffea eugenioides]|uniref:Transcription termination/antitermination protein NusG-like n=1 Tax=Coffea arabica TaxID=13443 RepID=A0A6P6SWD8_COFAR|nr:uncharacterized protein LOC113695288 [Coffea arabica]XP_027175243.1 uncharacterized protein LOC113774816 [Coffea eugenioides]
MIELQRRLLTWSPCPLFLSPSTHYSKAFNKLRSPIISFTISATVESVTEKQLTARERRQLRNERRESKAAYNWREEVEERLVKKPKKRYASWTEELNLDNLALLGPQWWVVRVSRVSGQDTADRLARALARNFPALDFKVYVPSVQKKKKLKNGSISVKPKALFPGCVFLRCVLNKDVHDFIRECDGVGGFVGSKVGNTKRQINKPRPVDAEDIEAIYKQAKEEQDKADQAFLEEHEGHRTSDFEKLNLDALPASLDDVESNTSVEAQGRSRKTTKPPLGFQLGGNSVKLLVPGSKVQVVSGAFAGFSGILKKFNKKKALATVSFTLFGKETLADLDVKEIVAEKN